MSSKTKPKMDAEFLFGKLQEKITGNPEAQRRVTAHIRAHTGHTTLPSFHHNGGSESEKQELYSACLKAVLTGDYSRLRGQNESQAEEPSQPALEVESQTAQDEPQPQPDPSGRLREVLLEMIGDRAGKVDEAKVTELVRKETKQLEERFTELVESKVNQAQKPVAFTLPGGATTQVEGAHHWQLPQLVTWLSADIPVWLWGQAGGGKTHLARQVAQALNLTPYVISVDPTMTAGKLLGFRNLASGEFVEGLLYRPYKEGGLLMLDEIDTGDPSILAALNALLANHHYMFPNGETAERHPEFRVMAGANTKGCGAVAGYTARNRLDAATLDRFAVIELAYDPGLEMSLATGQAKQAGQQWEQGQAAEEATLRKWVEYVQKARELVGSRVLISPRVSILGCRALKAGVPAEEVADSLLFKLTTTDTKASITSSLGSFQP